MKFFVILALVCVCVAGAFAFQECPENSHYESCGTACPLTCKNYKNPPKFCVLMCNPGCHCDPGYVKSDDGSCVLPEECSSNAPEQVCGENEQFNGCGTDCPLTCDNYDNPPIFCNKMCRIGCECKKGFVRNQAGKCVKPEQCPQRAAALDRPDCDKAAETGVCRAFVPRFYYDQVAGMCKSFIYGGCGGNRNNFETEEECYNKCGALASSNPCDQEKKKGPCRALFRKYFFNKETGKCELFYYGGCQGNDNRFNTQEECEAMCVH